MNSKQFRYFIILILSTIILLSSCSPYVYDGPEIQSITYVTIDYFGDYRNETRIDLNDAIVYQRQYAKADEETTDYEEVYTFEEKDISSFLDQFGAAGIFTLEDEYQTDDVIMDGGGWILTITYEDGSIRESTGDNVWPTELFEPADDATEALYGDRLFGTQDK